MSISNSNKRKKEGDESSSESLKKRNIEDDKKKNEESIQLWTLGISECHCSIEYDQKLRLQSSNKSDEKEDPETDSDDIENKIQVPENTTLLELIEFLCNGPIRERRDCNDYGVNQHLWELKIIPAGRSIESFGAAKEGKKYELCKPSDNTMPNLCELKDDLDCTDIVSTKQLVKNLNSLEVGGCIYLMYDYGTTTELLLSVLSVEECINSKLSLCILNDEVIYDGEVNENDIQQVPAFHLPKEQQIDAFYPNFSKNFIGKGHPMNAVTLGLSSRITRQDDTVFSSMESSSNRGNDVFFCATPFDDMNKFLTLGEEAWSSSKGAEISLSCTSRHIFPPNNREAYNKFQEVHESHPMKDFGPHIIALYKEKIEIKNQFDFSRTFPKTTQQLTSGKFRWIRYSNFKKGSVLKIIVGRGFGSNNRMMKKSQILRKWNKRFESFHELLCAVEASWKHPQDNYLSELGDVILTEHDIDLGPSKPLPEEPPILCKKEDTIIVSSSEGKQQPGVTALAVATTHNNTPVLYSGHENGIICKWDLTTNEIIWKRQVFQAKMVGKSTDLGHEDCGTPTGIRGIVAKESSSSQTNSNTYHEIFTWSHGFEPNSATPSKLKVLNGEDGMLLYSLTCEFDDVDAYPLISCVVFSKLKYNDEDDDWDEAIIVGLQATTEILEDDENYSDFDLEEAEDFAHGNILPFVDKVANESWRGHSGTIRSMAAVPDKFIVSCSECPGHRFAEMIILWCTERPGIPLHRIDLEKSTVQRKNPSLFHPVNSFQGGISIFKNKILLGCDYGDMIVPLEIIENESNGSSACTTTTCNIGQSSTLSMEGYAKIGYNASDLGGTYKGCLVGSGNVAIINNESCGEVWVFPINSIGQNPAIDTDLRRRTSQEMDDLVVGDTEFDAHNKILKAQGMADGQIYLPRQEGDTGPEVLAMKGRWVVAGYSCGTILRSTLLPETYGIEESTIEGGSSSNLFASSYLGESGINSTPHFDALKQAPPSQPERCTIM